MKLTRTNAFRLFLVTASLQTIILLALTYATGKVQQTSLMKNVTLSAVRVTDVIARATRYSMLLNRKEYPSWLFPVTKGATTVWERWDGIKPDGPFQDKGMNSFNHYAYGAIGEWLYKAVAGIEIDPQQPGYRHVLIQPHPGGGLDHAMAAIDTVYGAALSDWKIADGLFMLAVEVPPNSTATVLLPGARRDQLREGGHPIAAGNGVMDITDAEGAVTVKIGSGRYVF